MITALLLMAGMGDLCAVADGVAVAGTGLSIGERTLGEPRRVIAIAANADGSLLAEAGGRAAESGYLALWDVAEGRLVWERQVHEDLVYDVVWSADGSTLLTASGDGTVGRFTKSGEALEPLTGHSGQVLSLAVAPDGTLASGSLDRTIRIWGPDGHQRSLSRHAGAVGALSFSPDGEQLASASADGTVRIWQHRIGRQRKIVDLERGRVLDVHWIEAGLFASTSEGALCSLDPVRARVDEVLGEVDDWCESFVVRDREIVALNAAGELFRVALTSGD